MKILVVDDEKLIRDVIKEYLINENYEYMEASNGIEAIELTQKHYFDLMIMDIMMPQMDGYRACKEIFKNKRIPTIMLSARKEEYDKLLGFDLGIEDYVIKPFSPKELMARIKVIIKRNTGENKYIYKDLVVDYNGHTIKINKKLIKITPKEFELLLLFISNKGIALSREQILSKIWGYDFFGDDRTVDTHIKMLRNNLGEYRNLIITVRGLGYKFDEEE